MKVSDLYGLVLVGGRSKRMGIDKSSIQYHDDPQVEHLFKIMDECLARTFISVRASQTIDYNANLIEDEFDVNGPLNGLLSAHLAFPNKAWLVVAVDMPLVSKDTVHRLIVNRDENMLATAYFRTSDQLPEPLAAIWESNSLKMLEQSFDDGEIVYPRKFLVDNAVKLIQPESDDELLNVNEPKDLERVRALLKK